MTPTANPHASASACAATGPLAGIRVLDLTSVVLGPFATQILGDYGADVIKVEGLEGDLMRSNGVSTVKGLSSIFLAINRNKRSIAIDLKSPSGAAALKALLPTIDVLVHNMRVAAIERLGFGYSAVSALNPKLVFCVATGYGQDGPDRDKPAFDDVIQAGCGMAALIGHASNVPDYAPTLLADKTCGLVLANAVLAALFHRERCGVGQYVEVPMLETMTAFTMAEHLGGLTFDPPTAPAGYARLLAGGRKPAPTRDGFVAMLPYTTEHWEALFKHVGRSDLAQKYNLSDRYQRNSRIVELYADLALITGQMTTHACLAICTELDIPATRIYGINELTGHPQLQAVGLFQAGTHPSVGPMLSMRPTTKFSASPAELRRFAPVLGQHTLEVLREAGYDDAGVGQLQQDGAIKATRS